MLEHEILNLFLYFPPCAFILRWDIEEFRNVLNA